MRPDGAASVPGPPVILQRRIRREGGEGRREGVEKGGGEWRRGRRKMDAPESRI